MPTSNTLDSLTTLSGILKDRIPTINEVNPYSIDLKDTFASCLSVFWDGRLLTLEEVYDHVFKNDGGCTRCKKVFQRKIKRLQ